MSILKLIKIKLRLKAKVKAKIINTTGIFIANKKQNTTVQCKQSQSACYDIKYDHQQLYMRAWYSQSARSTLATSIGSGILTVYRSEFKLTNSNKAYIKS